jgi:hypothetical protein
MSSGGAEVLRRGMCDMPDAPEWVSGILGVVLQDEESLASGMGELENDLEARIQLWEEQYARVLVHDGYLLTSAFVRLDGVDVTGIRRDALH